jgi:hypothetical protein
MHCVLRPDPAHDRTLAPSLNVSGERVRTEHSVTNSQFVWSGESGEQARYRQIRPTEAIADKVGAAVCKLAECLAPPMLFDSRTSAKMGKDEGTHTEPDHGAIRENDTSKVDQSERRNVPSNEAPKE